MLLFVLYAVGVWYFAIRYRRRLKSFLAVAIGLAGLLLLNYFHTRLNDIWPGGIMLPVLRHMMYPYTALVVGIGLYIACLPRIEPQGSCAACGYSLRGLPHDEVDRCPECGIALGTRPRTERPLTSQPRTLATWKAATRARRQEAQAREARPPAPIATR